VLIKVQGIRFRCHKEVLIFGSPFFEAILKDDSGWRETRSRVRREGNRVEDEASRMGDLETGTRGAEEFPSIASQLQVPQTDVEQTEEPKISFPIIEESDQDSTPRGSLDEPSNPISQTNLKLLGLSLPTSSSSTHSVPSSATLSPTIPSSSLSLSVSHPLPPSSPLLLSTSPTLSHHSKVHSRSKSSPILSRTNLPTSSISVDRDRETEDDVYTIHSQRSTNRSSMMSEDDVEFEDLEGEEDVEAKISLKDEKVRHEFLETSNR
jgi:hypothetical protein